MSEGRERVRENGKGLRRKVGECVSGEETVSILTLERNHTHAHTHTQVHIVSTRSATYYTPTHVLTHPHTLSYTHTYLRTH